MVKPPKILIFSLLLIVALGLIGYTTFRYIQHSIYVKSSPYDVILSDIYSDTVTISWKTDVEKPSYIQLGQNEKLFGDSKDSKFHRVVLKGLKGFSSYNFVISDGKDVWEKPYIENSKELSQYVKDVFTFQTKEATDEIHIPYAQELNVLPNELVYMVVSDSKDSEIRSEYANRFGGLVIDTTNSDYNIDNIEYFSTLNTHTQNNKKVYAADINCDQDVSSQSIDGVNKKGFAQLALRWVAGRGKNYGEECFNDVVLRAKKAGVDPAFALSIWLNESGASNYTQNPNIAGKVEDFGIHGQPTVPAQNFDKQIKYFLNLTHGAACEGLTYWESWGNMYRWGNCNEDDPVKRQQGIDYYLQINTVYKMITNGKNLPSKVTGLPKSGGGDGGSSEDGDDNLDTTGSLCCAIKLDNQEQLRGDYENHAEDKTCDDMWAVGRSVYDGKIEYSVEIPDRVGSACEVRYDGVCCQLETDVRWYPSSVCTNVIEGVSNSQACKEYSNNRGCFFRDGTYQWLPKTIGDDSLTDVTTQSQCEDRNNLSTYKISLQKGVNFIGFDFEPSYNAGSMYASNLIANNSNILLVGNFQGYEWKDLIKKSEKLPFAGNDFTFEQNKGYLIITDQDTTLELDGWKSTESTYLPLENGWNLVGGSIYTKSSKASTLISNLKNSNLDIDTVGIWSNELGKFEYRREEEDTTVYGEDIKLETNKGIFIKK